MIAFTIQGIHPHDIATILDDDGVAIRAGHHCCQILHEKLNLTATARASIGVYNNKDDIDILLTQLSLICTTAVRIIFFCFLVSFRLLFYFYLHLF